MSEYIKCKICKHANYDEPVVTCDHPIGFGPDGECPIYGDKEEEEKCFKSKAKSKTMSILKNFYNKEATVVRQNMIDDKSYRPYCAKASLGTGCSMPRLDKDFICPECGWKARFDPEFFERYKTKHNL